jgi:hypothetical protein
MAPNLSENCLTEEQLSSLLLNYQTKLSSQLQPAPAPVGNRSRDGLEMVGQIKIKKSLHLR